MGNSASVSRFKWDRPGHLPKEILLDCANGIDRSHVGLDTKNLQTQASSLLNHLVCMVGVLLGHRIRFPLDIRGDVLCTWSAKSPKVLDADNAESIPSAQ